jgi:Uma2 family endonuclease
MTVLVANEELATYRERHRLTVQQLHRMVETGVLAADDRVELFEGEIFDMPPIGPKHASHTDHLTRLFVRNAPSMVVRVQGPVVVGPDSELVPDLAILRERTGGYVDSHPSPSDIVLLIEVSDSTLRYDREAKMALYGRSGIPESWILDLNQRRLEIYREPAEGGYRQILRPADEEVISPFLIPEMSLSVRALFLP